MPQPLETIVQRMIDAGEPEENIAEVIRGYSAAPTSQGPPNQHTASAEDFYTPNVLQQDIGTSIGQGAVGAVKEVAGIVPGVVHALTQSPIKTLSEATAARRAVAAKADTAETLPERLGYRVAGAIPFVGPLLARAGEQIGTGDPETMGRGAANTAFALQLSPTIRAATRSGLQSAGDTLGQTPGLRRMSHTLKDAAEHPVRTAIGGYEGYQIGGLPGLVAGAYGMAHGGHLLARTRLGRLLGIATEQVDEARPTVPAAAHPSDLSNRIPDDLVTLAQKYAWTPEDAALYREMYFRATGRYPTPAEMRPAHAQGQFYASGTGPRK